MLNSITGRFQDSEVGTITVAAPGAGRYNLVKSISGYSDATASIHIYGASTTTVVWAGLSGAVTPLVLSFPEGAEPKTAENTALHVSASAGTYRLSVTGLIAG